MFSSLWPPCSDFGRCVCTADLSGVSFSGSDNQTSCTLGVTLFGHRLHGEEIDGDRQCDAAGHAECTTCPR
jgi:hypothetical protein